jgi:hypothetical protein
VAETLEAHMQNQQRVEGHWRMELPSQDAAFKVQCFTDNHSGPSSDQLVTAWRDCNRMESQRDNDDGNHDIFALACATIIYPEGPGPRASRDTRELWVFTTTDAGAKAAREHVNHLQGTLRASNEG